MSFWIQDLFLSVDVTAGGPKMGPKGSSVLSHSAHCAVHKVQKVDNPVCNKSLQTAFRISILDTSSMLRLCVVLKAVQTGLILCVIGLLNDVFFLNN